MKQPIAIISIIALLSALWLGNAYAKPKVSVIATKAQAAEKGGLRGQFQLSLDAPDKKPVTVSYSVSGSAKVGKDYKKIKAKTTIKSGQTVAYVDVIPVADKKAEKPEIIKLTLKNGRNYLRGNARSATVQITDDPVPGSATFPTYQNTTLPGRLVVGQSSVRDPSAEHTLYNLRTGTKVNLPNSARPDDDDWSIGEGGATLLRQANGRQQKSLFSFFNAASLAQTKPDVDVNTDYISLFGSRLSPDGRYILTFRHTGVGEDSLTIYDATSGNIVKTGSMLNGMSVISMPAAWLPDGRYVYLHDRDMYISSPTVFSSQFIARLAIPSFSLVSADTDVAVSPDGQRLAFSQREERGVSSDSHLWVVNVDGSGLHRLTLPQNPSDPSDYFIVQPAWSPDGQWIAGVLQRPTGTPTTNITTFPITGCAAQVLVFPASASNTAVAKFPDYDTTYGVKVASPKDGSAQWLTTCSNRIAWLP